MILNPADFLDPIFNALDALIQDYGVHLYPGTLDALMPQFIDKLPHDIIGGEPLQYRRSYGGNFLLYSAGWNETDDAGR